MGKLFYWKQKINQNREYPNGLKVSRRNFSWGIVKWKSNHREMMNGEIYLERRVDQRDLSKCLLVILLPISKFPPGKTLLSLASLQANNVKLSSNNVLSSGIQLTFRRLYNIRRLCSRIEHIHPTVSDCFQFWIDIILLI